MSRRLVSTQYNILLYVFSYRYLAKSKLKHYHKTWQTVLLCQVCKKSSLFIFCVVFVLHFYSSPDPCSIFMQIMCTMPSMPCLLRPTQWLNLLAVSWLSRCGSLRLPLLFACSCCNVLELTVFFFVANDNFPYLISRCKVSSKRHMRMEFTSQSTFLEFLV